jgi:hypothetical protein
MSMSSNEHAHNTDAKLTNNLQSVHIFSALKESKVVEFHLCLCIVHYALKETSELCTILMPSNEHACTLMSNSHTMHNNNARFSSKEINKIAKYVHVHSNK